MESVRIGYCQYLECWQLEGCEQHKSTQDAAEDATAVEIENAEQMRKVIQAAAEQMRKVIQAATVNVYNEGA